MKKLLFVVVFIAMVATASNAQWKFGGGLTLGTQVSIDDDLSEKMGFGLNARADYSFNDQWSVAPGITIFFPSSPDGIDYSTWQLNGDAHYKFYSEDAFNIYGLAGLNLTFRKVDFGLLGDNTDNELGLDLGAGINFGQMFFGELKYDSAYEQLGITIGVLFGGN